MLNHLKNEANIACTENGAVKIGRAYRIPKAHILRYLKITCSTFAE